MDRLDILLGRLHNLETYQCKTVNMLQGIVSDGVLPQEIWDKIRSPEVQEKFRAKIAKAERIRWTIAIEITNIITKT